MGVHTPGAVHGVLWFRVLNECSQIVLNIAAAGTFSTTVPAGVMGTGTIGFTVSLVY